MAVGPGSTAADVVLVGRRLPDAENLGLGYLLAALRKDGRRGEAATLNSAADLAGIATRILETNPKLVGLSLPDGGSAFLALGLGELLRRRGYRGHVTAGGGFATAARSWLLGRFPWLDSVVRFAGEVPLCALAARLAAGGDDAEGIPGITTRSGDGAPAPVLDPRPLELVPERVDLPEILGHPLVHIAATRGCPGRCAYCGPAALQDLEREEGRRAGRAEDELRAAGVGGVRRRELEALCDEMAELWHGRGVRYFYFVDEHLLPWSEAEALDWLARWQRELERREVGARGIGAVLRADLLTPAVARTFREVGLVRAFVGVELASREELAAFGRGGDPAHSLAMVGELERLGVATISNLLLVHPYSTPATVGTALDWLGEVRRGTFEPMEMRVYHGTRLHERMAAEGRLRGNPLRWGYRHADPAIERFAALLHRLRSDAWRDYSLSFRLHDAALALVLAHVLHPEAAADDLRERVRRIGAAANALRVAGLREALRLACRGGTAAEAGELVRVSAVEVERLRRIADAATAELLGRIPRPGRIYAPMRTASACLLSFCLAGAATGCSGGATLLQGDADGADATGADGAPDGARETRDAGDAAAEVPCPDEARAAMEAELRRRAAESNPCATLDVSFPSWSSHVQVRRILDWTSRTVPEWGGTIGYCWGEHEERLRAEANAFAASLADLESDCLRYAEVAIDGGDRTEIEAIEDAAMASCPDSLAAGCWESVRVRVDTSGVVVDVEDGGGWCDPGGELLDCLRAALVGLEFPCLAGTDICTEPPIFD
ncbi:MAG: radical SAM protein [Deltaproteobacteria bacterium]|nr:radical SAM protein [Deltaproteobacteria bacterium]